MASVPNCGFKEQSPGRSKERVTKAGETHEDAKQRQEDMGTHILRVSLRGRNLVGA